MKRLYFVNLLLWALLFAQHSVGAEGVTHIAFWDKFDSNIGTGGNDGVFSGSVGSYSISFDVEGWTGEKVYGADGCVKFGTSSATGICVTPEISLVGRGKTAVLTFRAAGWGDANTNRLAVTANDGVELSGDTLVKLTNAAWTDYTVAVSLAGAESVQLTFSGKRGFLDDVKVTEDVTAINSPVLTDELTFWPKTTETAAQTVMVMPADSTIVYYTTDGTEPSPTNGLSASMTTPLIVSTTTTIKAVACFENLTSDVVSRTYTEGATVGGVAAFKALADGTEVRLFLGDEADARVLHGDDHRALYLRDNSGTLCLDFGTTAVFNPAPQHNQHVAGWVIGRKQTDNGLTKLVATAHTNTDYLALAAPVTEAPTEPLVIAACADGSLNISDYMGDWVAVGEAEIGRDMMVEDRFGAEHYTVAYDQAIADVSGIVTADGLLSPVYYDAILPVVYVIDEERTFHQYNDDIPHATVRLKRTLYRDSLNTLTLPFATTIEGEVFALDDVTGNTMVFNSVASLEAGRPYIVKPYEDMVNPVFSDVTLTATPAQGDGKGGYAFVGTYSPEALADGQTVMLLKGDGSLLSAAAADSQPKGMSAYFLVPEGETVSLSGLGELPADITEKVTAGGAAVRRVYDLQGRQVSGMSGLRPGLYIVNGKKIVINSSSTTAP